MKKIKGNKGINRKNKEIIKKMEEIENSIIVDVMLSNIDSILLKKYYPLVDNYNDAMVNVIRAFKSEIPIANIIMRDLIKLNNENVKDFLHLTIEQLEEEYNKNTSPAISGIQSISPDMIIFYYVSNNLKGDERYKFSLKKHKEEYKEFEKTLEINKDKKRIELKGLKNSKFELELNAFFRGEIIDSLKDIPIEERIKDLCDRYQADYNKDKLIINQYILLFFDLKAKEIIDTRIEIQELYNFIFIIARQTYRRYEKKKYQYEDMLKTKSENDRLKNENMLLEKEIKFLNKKEEELSRKNHTEELLKLSKENYYLNTKIENLEEELREAKEEFKNLKDIKDDLIIEEGIPIHEKINSYYDEAIIIVGGKWDSKKKAETQSKYTIDFVTAEDALKNSKRYKNYDIVIFDTSRNSHINFYKVKSIVNDYYLISKSDIESIDKLFEK